MAVTEATAAAQQQQQFETWHVSSWYVYFSFIFYFTDSFLGPLKQQQLKMRHNPSLRHVFFFFFPALMAAAAIIVAGTETQHISSVSSLWYIFILFYYYADVYFNFIKFTQRVEMTMAATATGIFFVFIFLSH